MAVKTCKILFIIGNGFDLHLGMETKYTDVYKKYVKAPSADKDIEKFKKDISNNHKTWADFEMALPEYAKKVSSEAVLIKCLRDFKTFIADFLQEQNESVIRNIQGYANHPIRSALHNTLNYFYSSLTPNAQRNIANLKIDSNIQYYFLTFNYTTVLDELLRYSNLSQSIIPNAPLHIHGSLETDITMGIDNEEQFKGYFSLSRKGKRSIIKPIYNSQYDSKRAIDAKDLIRNSDIICTYGFSFGESDQTWVDLLADWLLENPDHQLVVYDYKNHNREILNKDEMMDIEDDEKLEFLKRLALIPSDDILNQVNIPIGANLFNFPDISPDLPDDEEERELAKV